MFQSFAKVAHVAPAGGGITDPTDITGLELWVRADLGVTAPGNLVTDWADQSGNGNDFANAPAGGTTEPVLVASDINGHPGIQWNGDDDQSMVGPDLTALTEAEVFVVWHTTDPPAEGPKSGIWFLGDDTDSHYPFTDGNVYDCFGTTSRKATGNPIQNLGVYHWYNVISIAGEWTSNINGNQHFTTASNTVGFDAIARIGASSLFTTRMEGSIAELFIYNRKLSDEERTLVNDYIQDRYDL